MEAKSFVTFGPGYNFFAEVSPSCHFNPSPRFENKIEAFPGRTIVVLHSMRLLLPLPTNNRLGWKWLMGIVASVLLSSMMKDLLTSQSKVSE